MQFHQLDHRYCGSSVWVPKHGRCSDTQQGSDQKKEKIAWVRVHSKRATGANGFGLIPDWTFRCCTACWRDAEVVVVANPPASAFFDQETKILWSAFNIVQRTWSNLLILHLIQRHERLQETRWHRPSTDSSCSTCARQWAHERASWRRKSTLSLVPNTPNRVAHRSMFCVFGPCGS